MADNLGSGVSRALTADDRQFDYVVWQKGKPPLDSELNLIGQTHSDQRAELLRALIPSGFLGNGINPQDDYFTHLSYSNIMYLGRQNETFVGDQVQINNSSQRTPIAVVNGWMIPLVGSRTNLGSIVKNDDDKRNLIELPFGATTGFQSNFVFLEVWRQLVQPNDTTGKPSTSELWKFGNTEFGGTNVPDAIIDPALNFPTTLRVQLQYRIRVLPSVNILTHPDGFGDSTVVFARANKTESEGAALGFNFSNMAHGHDDQGLWRSGDGDPNNGLGAVDGYTYAIPIAAVHRRNRGGFDLNNVNGALTRVQPPSGYVEGTPAGKILTDPEIAAIGASDRPDQKYADFVVSDDITDLRHIVNPGGFDYDSLLKHNLSAIFQGELKASPKSFSAGGTRIGPELLYIDEITGGADNPGSTTVGAPDGTRRVFSDAMTPQDDNLSIVTPDTKDAGSPSKSFKPNSWEPEDIIKLPLPSSLNSGENAARFLSERTRIVLVGGTQPLASGTVVSSGATSVTLESGKMLTAFEGRAIRITSGTGVGQIRTIANPVTPPSAVISPAWTTNPDSTSTFEILEFYTEIDATIDNNSQLQITIINLNGQTTFADAGPVAGKFTSDLVIEYSLLYPAGNGLALRPDKFHEINYTNPNTSVVLRETALTKNLLSLAYIQHDPSYCNPTHTVIKLSGTLENATSNTATVGDLIGTNGTGLACGPGTEDQAAEAIIEGASITLCRGPGAGQVRTILSYDSVSGIVVVDEPWDVIPSSLTQFEILTFHDSRSYFGNEFVNTEAYFDPGSKTVKVQPWQDASETFEFEALQVDPVLKNAGLNDYFNTAFVIDIPKSLLPPVSRQDTPILSVNQNGFPAGLNGPVYKVVSDINANDQIVQHFGRVSETDFGNAVFEVSPGLIYEDRNTADPIVDRIGCRYSTEVDGIELPRHFGLSRVRAVFEKSDFDTLGYSGTNLLLPHSDANPLSSTVLISRRSDSEIVTFTLYGDVISGFSDTNSYVVIADVFGYDRGFLVDNGRVFATDSLTVNDGDSHTLHLLLTKALPIGSITQIAYSREPYQGDIYNSVEPFADTSPEPFNNRGLPSGEQLSQLDQPLQDAPERGDEFTYEILAECQFATTAGTGRFSGESPHCKIFDITSVNPKEPYYPGLDLGDINTELSGLITRIPLGARWRDAHFVADNFVFGERYSNFVPFMGSSGPYHKIHDNSNNLDYSQNGMTVGAELTLTEGKNANYNTPDQFRVTRGGSAYMRDGKKPGGPLGGTGGRGDSGYNLVYGVAALVRNNMESVSSVNKNYGGELQLVIATGVGGPGQKMFSVALNSNGLGEGDAASDRYRVRGRPLEKIRKGVTHGSLAALASRQFSHPLPGPHIKYLWPLVVDKADEITIVGENFGSTIYMRESQSNDRSFIDMNEHAFKFEKDKIRFSIPTFHSQFPASADGALYDVAIQNPDGQLEIREGALQLRANGLGGTTNKMVFFEGFEGYKVGSVPAENPLSELGDAWVTTAFATTLASPAGEGFTLQEGLLVSDACSLSARCVHFRGLSEEANNNPTSSNFLARQISELDIDSKVSSTLSATHALSFAFKYGEYPGQEEVMAGFFTSTLSKSATNAQPLVEIFRNVGSATYIIRLGPTVEGSQVIVDTNVSLDDVYHIVELQMWPTAGNYTLLFDGVVQRTGSSLASLMTLTTEELRAFEIEAFQPVQNGSLPGVRVELFVDNISVRQLN